MKRNKAVSVMLLFSMLVSLLIGSGMTAYGAEASGESGGVFVRPASQSEAAENPASQSEAADGSAGLEALGTAFELEGDYSVRLKLQGEQTNYQPGEPVFVTVLAERKEAAEPVSLLDDDILINTKVFGYVSSSAIQGSVISPNYTYEGESPQTGWQRVKLLYSSQIAGDAQSSPLELEVATLKLQVRDTASLGVYDIKQELKGLSAAGQDVTDTVAADPLPVTIGNGQKYELTVATAEASRGTVTGGGTFAQGTEVPISATAAPGYRFVGWTGTGGGQIKDLNSPTTVYTMPGNAATVTASFTETTDPTVRLKLEKSAWNRNDTITLDLQVEKNGLTDSIRMLDYDLVFDTRVFELTSSSAIQGTVISGDYTYEGESRPPNSQRVKILYSSQNQAASQSDPLKVATLKLKVKETATVGTYELKQAVKGLSIGAQDRAETTNLIPVMITVQPASSGVEVSGYVGYYYDETTVPKLAAYRVLVALDGADTGVVTDKNGYFVLEGVPAGAHTLTLSRADGIDRTLEITVDRTPLAVSTEADRIAFLTGDYDQSKEINGLDYIEFMNEFGKEEQGNLADYDQSGSVNGLDYIEFLRNFGKSY